MVSCEWLAAGMASTVRAGKAWRHRVARCEEVESTFWGVGRMFEGVEPDGTRPAALAGAVSATSAAEKPRMQVATSSVAVAVLSDRPGRGVSHSRAAPRR
jgi:hypothetical protein